MGAEKSSPATLEDRTLEAVASLIKNGKARRIVVLTGAGISTSAGIPDFRSPKTGLYANLARLNLPYPQAVFDISFFRKNPEPFYVLAKELFPGSFHPTFSHAFVALLAKKGLLHMLFTQNIDCLERAAGVPADRIIEAHGSFASQRCIECKEPFADDLMRRHVERGDVPRCPRKRCGGLVKPDIVFFGEGLPPEFSRNSGALAEADLVLVLGTSLTVYPFATLPELCSPRTPRVLFNLEKVGSVGSRPDDVLELGPCDDGVAKLARELGWLDELDALWRKTVGKEEARRQLVRRGALDEALQEVGEDILESLAAGVEGLELKGDDGGEDAGSEGVKEEKRVGSCEQGDKEALMTGKEPSQSSAEPPGQGAGQGLENHLEAHIHQKMAKTGGGPDGASAASDTPSLDKESEKDAPGGTHSESPKSPEKDTPGGAHSESPESLEKDAPGGITSENPKNPEKDAPGGVHSESPKSTEKL